MNPFTHRCSLDVMRCAIPKLVEASNNSREQNETTHLSIEVIDNIVSPQATENFFDAFIHALLKWLNLKQLNPTTNAVIEASLLFAQGKMLN